MKILKKILLVVAILIAIPLIIALFLKKQYSVERQITIDRPKLEVFTYIKYLKNQNDYSKWAKMDRNMKKDFRGTDGTVGFVSAWESVKKDVGIGEQEIVKITEGERIDFEIRFIEPFASIAQSYMTTDDESENKTLVKWGFNGNMSYPFNLMLLFMDLDKNIGGDLTIGLSNLKEILENNN